MFEREKKMSIIQQEMRIWQYLGDFVIPLESNKNLSIITKHIEMI